MSSADESGAVAAATYFAELYSYAWATGDTSSWEEMSSEACEWCTQVADDIAAMVSSRERSTGASMLVEESNGTEIEPQRWYSADLRVIQGSSQRLAADGTVLSDSPGGRFRFFAALSWTAGSWQVDAVDILDVEREP